MNRSCAFFVSAETFPRTRGLAQTTRSEASITGYTPVMSSLKVHRPGVFHQQDQHPVQ